MRKEDQNKIRSLEIFSHIKDETFQYLTSPGFLQRFPPGVKLVEENHIQDFLYILIEGQVEMYAVHNKRETTLDIIQPVGLFILAAVLNDGVCLQSARTLTDAQVLMIPVNHVKKAMEEDISFMHAVVRELARCYRTTIKELKNQKLRNSNERLANWILKQFDVIPNGHYFVIPFEKRILASRLGMTPENLSRAFANLAEYGVRLDGPRVIITERQKLLDFAKPNKLIDKIEPL